MEEGLYTFDVFTYDLYGNRSIGSQVSAEVYGDTYQQTISNRRVKSIKWVDIPEQEPVQAFKGAEISWFGVNPQAIFIDINYVMEDGTCATLREQPVKQSSGSLVYRETTRLPTRLVHYLPDCICSYPRHVLIHFMHLL